MPTHTEAEAPVPTNITANTTLGPRGDNLIELCVDGATKMPPFISCMCGGCCLACSGLFGLSLLKNPFLPATAEVMYTTFGIGAVCCTASVVKFGYRINQVYKSSNQSVAEEGTITRQPTNGTMSTEDTALLGSSVNSNPALSQAQEPPPPSCSFGYLCLQC